MFCVDSLNDVEICPVSLIIRTKPVGGGALYLGGKRAPLSVGEPIDVHMACAGGLPPDPWAAEESYHIPLDDNPKIDWLSKPLWVAQVSAAANLVAASLSKDKVVLVTCHMGLNRSGLVSALALCMCGMKPDVAVVLLREQRHDYVLCNSKFCTVVQVVGGEMFKQAQSRNNRRLLPTPK